MRARAEPTAVAAGLSLLSQDSGNHFAKTDGDRNSTFPEFDSLLPDPLPGCQEQGRLFHGFGATGSKVLLQLDLYPQSRQETT
jgi:hypothetical protein